MKVINIIPYLNQTLCSGQYTIDCSIESFEGFAVNAKGELRTRSPILVAPPSISCKSDTQQLGRRRAVTGLLPSGVRDGM
ncbi:hypothetical protein JOQ06_024217 [Pogonophryne albipinna]|uniref:Uncharacterized protein n=1 Tax=Pogonophryne albipinna TaxID=1090488 RepID=A0AAD6BLM8_9TELE|nr:hypothetical protein JOQ06_024217 [Pogonophryne albipinna]